MSWPSFLTDPPFITFIAAFSAVYWTVFFFVFKRYNKSARVRDLQRQFFRAVENALRNAAPDQQLAQLKRHHESYSAIMHSLDENPRSLAGDLWYIVESMDANGLEVFQKRYRVKMGDDQRNTLAKLVASLDAEDPFAHVPSPWSVRIKNVAIALKNLDANGGTAALTELADELRQREEILRKAQERRERKNLRLQWAGIILGVVSFIVGTILTIAFT
ncbi:class R serpentine receptor [Micromonospora peucetia]|uniref:Class R serpentine receptor n=1 Tax=Micromonospora peucetia TaxID=47871 RepID=A0A1C6W4K5_9ACTN|nr:hypothetical protein [Micromonospora peucetia]MCX4390111.1 class R serpentine receptor [Micromonospora peucetia]WSA32580.1 class R serpentine receptor [Micromonospora peucetia]SCL73446.1 hypothetical protein GA0070608_5731 [Micromonospora peucetia]